MKAPILFVDDREHNLMVLEAICSGLAIDSTRAYSGEEAIIIAPKIMPALILLDVQLPEMDGFECAQILRSLESTKNVPIIFVTAHDPEGHKKFQGYEQGAVDYLYKPLDPYITRQKIQIFVTLYQQRQEVIEKEQEIRAIAESLQLANDTKEQFFSIIAHDLKGTLSSIKNLTQALADDFNDFSPEEATEFVRRINLNANKVYNFTENLLQWARLSSDTLIVSLEKINLSEKCASILDLLTEMAEAKAIRLSQTVPSEVFVTADQVMLDQVLQNLVSNAVKFTKAQGEIQISATLEEERVKISVSDTGLGMSEEQINNLFRFDVKSNLKGTAGEEGTGMGLKLCQKFVELQGGVLEIESQLGKGSMFSFTLPRFKPEAETE